MQQAPQMTPSNHDQQQETDFKGMMEQFTKSLGEHMSENEKATIKGFDQPPQQYEQQQPMPPMPNLPIEEESLSVEPAKPKKTKQHNYNEMKKNVSQAKKLLAETELEKEEFRLKALELEAKLKAQEEQTLLVKRQEAAADAIEAEQLDDAVAKVRAFDKLSRINHEIVQNQADQNYYDNVLRQEQANLKYNQPEPEPEPEYNPVFEAWLGQNPWYMKSPHLRDASNKQMIDLENELYLRGEDHLIGTPQFFSEIKSRMFENIVQKDRSTPPNYYPPAQQAPQQQMPYNPQQQQPTNTFVAPTHQRGSNATSSGNSNWLPELSDEQKMWALGFPRRHDDGTPYKDEEKLKVYAENLRDHYPHLIERQRRY